jgi:hypothetical protein
VTPQTDRFFAASGVQFALPNSGLSHFHRVAFSARLKAKVGSILAKAAALMVNLNIDGAPSLQEHILTHHTRKHLVS